MSEVYAGAVDKGLEGVIACTTAISSIVDAALCYRGYLIEDLAENSSFEETVYLLWNDHLPSKEEYTEFKNILRSELSLRSEQIELLKQIPVKDVHPMAWLRTAVSLLALWDKESQLDTPEAHQNIAIRLTAKMGTLVALFERLRQGKGYVAPNPEKSFAWNFLYMISGQERDDEIVKIFDTCLILHADHELNCSAFASRVTASSLSDIYSAVTSAIGALKGPLHGGANERVMRMLVDIKTVEKAKQWVDSALTNKEKIMGFGHRVYKNGDPRAKILRSMSESLCNKSGNDYYKMSKVIDDTVQTEKGLLPNVDFYSASVYYSMGIPLDLYTSIFTVSRVSGWLAHILEQYKNNRIYRPRGEWVGKTGLKYAPLSGR